MMPAAKRTLFILALVTLLSAMGCKLSSIVSSSGNNATGRSATKEERTRIEKSLSVSEISVYQSGVNFARVYGDIGNNSDKLIKKIKFTIIALASSKKEVGKGEIVDLSPKTTKSYDIQTTAETGQDRGFSLRIDDIQI